MMLFFIGIIEMIVVTAWTSVVSKAKVFKSGAITSINVLIWYYILNIFVNDINNWKLLVLYAAGCSVGTMLTTYFFQVQKKKARAVKKLKSVKKVYGHSNEGATV